MASDQMIVAAVGRPFKLGMLYDARTDQLLQGSALWSSNELETMTHRKAQPFSDFRMSASESFEEKASLLELQASLRASVLCGLVKGGGSVSYLQDHQEFKNQCRVTLKYKATTHFEQLSLSAEDWENIVNKEVMEEGLATHVVTGIEYGANAFFVFDSQILEASDVQEFRLKIKVVILRFIHFDYNRDLTEEEKSLVKTLKVKVYSDFLLETPATFTEAVQTYTDMTKLLRDENAVPVRVWLIPLKHHNTKTTGLVRHISVGLVQEAESVLEDLASVTMRVHDCQSVNAVGKFPELYQKLNSFDKLCHCYTVELQRQMAEICPAIREGTEPESVLRRLFEQRDKSPFSQEKLTNWLDDQEREINVVQSCLDIMKGIPVLSTQAEVDRFVLAPENAVCRGYIFISLQNTDPLLRQMGQHLHVLRVDEPYEEPVQESAQSWYYCGETVSKMREMAQVFRKTSTSVFIASEYRDECSGAAVVNYRDGQVVEN